MRHIDNVFIFSFIQAATGQKKFSPIFRALHLEASNSGRRFKEGLYGRSWWPKHVDWYGHLWSENPNICRVARQEFPLQIPDADKSAIQEKEDLIEAKRAGIDKVDTVGSEIPLPAQWTFESCLYDYLIGIFKTIYHNDFPAILYALSVHGKKYELAQACINELASQPDQRSLARFLIVQAKAAAGSPLESSECTIQAVQYSENLHTDDVELCTFFDLQSQWTALEISEQLVQNDIDLFPAEALISHGGTAKMWRDHILANPENWMFLCNRSTKKIVGNWSFAFITPEQEESVRAGTFLEGDFTVGKRQDVLSSAPDSVAIYLLNLSANDRTEDSRLMLWRSFVNRIQALAKKGIFLKGIYTNALNEEHESVFRCKGFAHIIHNVGGGEIYYLDLKHGFPKEFSYIASDLDLESLCYQYWRDQFKCIQLTHNDVLSEQQERDLARLIWQTDRYIYPAMFTQEQAEEILPILLASNSDPMFNLDSIYCGMINDSIVGIILHHKGPLNWSAESLKEEGSSLPASLDKVETDYFSEYQHTSENTRSIINCCIDERWRMRGIRLGSEMMQQFLMEHPDEEFELYVLEETPAAYKLYRRAGFRKIFKCNGFSIDRRELPCFYMRRSTKK